MLTRLLHTVAARPRVYEAIQLVLGAKAGERHLKARISGLRSTGTLLDIAGGTGRYLHLWPDNRTYICLDLDPVKLRGFRERHPQGTGLQADATSIPLASESLDVALCNCMSHHLLDAQFGAMIDECRRVLRPSGSLVFLDAVWKPSRLPGRVLWRFDRGAYPKTERALRDSISRGFQIESWDRYTMIHEYVMCVATPMPLEHVIDPAAVG